MSTLLIHAIQCVAVSGSKLTPQAKAAINTTVDVAASVATAAGGYGVIVGMALKAGKEIFNAVADDLGSGPDQLYLNLSNQERERRIWPLLSEYYEIQSGQEILELSSQSLTLPGIPIPISVPMAGPLEVSFQDKININFWEWDSGSSDDFLGRLSVDESSIGRMMSQIVGNPEEGSIYVVAYSVEAPRWASLGGIITGEPSAITNLDGQLAIFAKGVDNGIWWKKQINSNGDWETHWNSLNAPPTGAFSNPAVALNATGAMVVFVQGSDNAIWHRWQASRNSQVWSDWVSLGGSVTSAPSAVLDKNGCLVVFSRGTDNAIWYRWQLKPNQEWSAEWQSIGGIATSAPNAVLNADNQVVVFVRGTDNAIWAAWQTKSYTAPNRDVTEVLGSPQLPGVKRKYGEWIDTWEPLGGSVTSAPVSCLNADGGLVVFVRGADNAIWHRWQTTRNGNWSETWESLYGDASSSPAATRSQDGRLVVFVRGTDNAVWHRWQTTRNGNWF